MNNIEQPLVSIIINCYNSEKYLRQAIDSILAQTYENWEIIFWDNQSTDGSANIVKGYRNNKIKYYYAQSHTSLGEARKDAIGKANGVWIAFLDCDDFWIPQKLEIQMQMVANKNYVLCYAGISEISPDEKIIRNVHPMYESGNMFEKQLMQFDINMVTPIIRKDVLDKFSINFNPKITASEEYNLFMRLAAKGDICAIPQILGSYRVYNSSLTNKQISRWAIERQLTIDQIKEENPGIDKEYPLAFEKAIVRGVYYSVRYLMSEGHFLEARKRMKSIRFKGRLYFVLWLFVYFPKIWAFIHSPNIKRKILNLFSF